MTTQQRIETEKAFERRLIQRCKSLISPVLDVTRFDARIILYPRETRRVSWEGLNQTTPWTAA